MPSVESTSSSPCRILFFPSLLHPDMFQALGRNSARKGDTHANIASRSIGIMPALFEFCATEHSAATKDRWIFKNNLVPGNCHDNSIMPLLPILFIIGRWFIRPGLERDNYR